MGGIESFVGGGSICLVRTSSSMVLMSGSFVDGGLVYLVCTSSFVVLLMSGSFVGRVGISSIPSISTIISFFSIGAESGVRYSSSSSPSSR
jgi:hypothetical protein